jgi:hypothetical protein
VTEKQIAKYAEYLDEDDCGLTAEELLNPDDGHYCRQAHCDAVVLVDDWSELPCDQGGIIYDLLNKFDACPEHLLEMIRSSGRRAA